MTSDPDNLVLSLLRSIRDDIGQIKADVIEVKERLGLLEAGYTSLSRRVIGSAAMLSV